MLKYILYIALIIIISGASVGILHLYRVSLKNKEEMNKYSETVIAPQKNSSKTLVIYYSLSGKTKDIAMRIKEKTNADIYEIKTLEGLPKGPKLHFAVKQQLKTKKHPEIRDNIPNIDDYDVIFIGAPVWWYTIATPALSFLEKVDFKGKKVVPFSTQGSNTGTFFEDFNRKAKNAVILESAKFNNMPDKYNNALDNKISIWINSLDI